MKSRLREEYFKRKELMLIEAQLNKTDAMESMPEAQMPWIPSMPERAELAGLVDSGDMRSPHMLESRIAAVQAVADLCSRVERPKRSGSKPNETIQNSLSARRGSV